ncbi:MAG TPA: c-type cytochrome biogenesis protein CcmI [Gammaproteobacteria bacterium]
MSFFLVAAVMMLIACLAVGLPLWRGRAHASAGMAQANRGVHASRLQELQEDLQNGRLSAEDHAAAQRDLERDLAAGAQDSAFHAARPSRIAAVISIMVVLAAAAGLYWRYGSWRVGSEGLQAASAQAVIQMVDDLAARLHTPEGQADLQGWTMLGHSYMIMGRYPDALDAFGHARALSKDSDPQVLSSYAESVALSDPDAFMDKALPVFEQVLKMDPHNVQALWYGGLGALQRGDRSLAVQRWNAVLAQDPPAEYRRVIEKAIAAAGGTAEKTEGVEGGATATMTAISVHVSLAPSLAAKATPDATVFVYVQPKDGAGGPPLAARRFKVSDLPLDLRLSDQDAVLPGRVISAYADVVVSARISSSGTPAPRAGDLMGRAGWHTGGKPLRIVINTVLK